MDQNELAIEARGLSLYYLSVSALAGIDLRIPRGSVVGLVGRNGAGKSSLLRCLVGLTVPDSGDAQLLGCASTALSDDVRNRLGYVGQTPDLLEWLQVGEHVEYIGSFYSNWSAARARELCIRFDLPEGLRVRTLSQGQKQRLSVVLALAHDPELVLMDEPVASLDPVARRDFMRTLFEGAADRTAVISSHLLGDLERVVSHVIFLRDGRIQLSGAWDELMEHVRLVDGTTAMPKQPGLIHTRTEGGQWRHLVDMRSFDVTALTAGAQMRALNLDDLFAELQA